MSSIRGDSLSGKTVSISGSGNVAIFAAEKAQQLGATVVTLSDSSGYIHDSEGIQVDIVKDIKFNRRGRIKEYAQLVPSAEYRDGYEGVWSIPCDVALPCATQNELDIDSAKTLIANGCTVVCEGANMPTTPEAIEALQQAGVIYGPGKAANAGGVAVSGLEMSQNSQRLPWSFDDVDQRLHTIMVDIFHTCAAAADSYGSKNDLMRGANIAGFLKVGNAMIAQGVL
jgi:glutamate dehydrogenase (NADP+)